MIKNFFTIAWRNILRNKLHSLINITGLSIGVSACLVIYLIVTFELSFNKGFEGYDRIYRVHSSFKGVFSGLNRGVPTAVGPAIKEQFKGVESVTSFHVYSSNVIIPSSKEKKDIDRQEGIAIVEPSYFDVFDSYEWVAGSAKSLEKPFQTVLTESRAKKYFGTADPNEVLGKEIIYRDSLNTTVAGIVKDLPFNADLDFHDFISFSTIENSWVKKRILLNDWTSVNSGSQLFVKLEKTATLESIKAQIPILSKEYKERSQWDVDNEFNFQPLSDLHYNAETGIFDHSRSPAHLPTLSSLILVAVLLLIIGSINFVNLETAQAIRRAKEVGVRKVLGSTQLKLIVQFLSESFIITFAAVLLALPIAELALNFFAEFVPAGVELKILNVIPILLAIGIIVGLLAGSYPAFALSSFLPAKVLKSNVYVGSRSSSSSFLRKSLIVFQFTFAQALIIATLIVGWQINFMLNKDLGFKKDAVVYLNAPGHEKQSKTLVLKNEIEKIPGVSKISMSEAPPSYNGWSSSTIKFNAKEEIKLSAFRKFGDPNYIDFYGIEILAGKNLSPSDTVKELLINETLMKSLGFTNPQDAVGQQIELNKKMLPIIGVVKDFHIQSLHVKVEPVMIADNSENFDCFNIKMATTDGDQMKATIAEIEKAWKKIYPDAIFEYEFLDDTIKNFYESEQRISKLVSTATILAIFISCLGLFGLASYTAVQRTKEIGIRKVMGASSQSIVMLLSRDFILLVLLAFVLAAPVAWYAGNMWLEGYAYQVEIQVWLFAVTALCAVVIAYITVGYQTLKAANSNPVSSLRNE